MRIRHATPADIPQIRRLEEQAPMAAHWDSTQYDALFSPWAAPRTVFVATGESDDSAIAGFLVARCLADEWEIENVVVGLGFRRQGIGSRLVGELLHQAGTAGASALLLEVRESNLPAVRLYESIGFKPEGRRQAYYQNPSEDALLFRLWLQSCDKMP